MSFCAEIPFHSSESLYFVFQNQQLLIRKYQDRILIPSGKDIFNGKIKHSRPFFIGKQDHRPCFCTYIPESIPELQGLEFHGLRQLFENLPEKIFRMASLGLQVTSWDKVSKYCGKCGSRLRIMKTERAKKCLSCDHIEYPRISPAVIMAVTRGKKILLARSNHIRSSFYSVLAGYVEMGETLEECVLREVHEEVGLGVKNICYYGSQSWPFTNSLMIGFIAEHAFGEIHIDKSEILDAAWFTPDNLPQLPGWGSISRRLVDFFVKMTIE